MFITRPVNASRTSPSRMRMNPASTMRCTSSSRQCRTMSASAPGRRRPRRGPASITCTGIWKSRAAVMAGAAGSSVTRHATTQENAGSWQRSASALKLLPRPEANTATRHRPVVIPRLPCRTISPASPRHPDQKCPFCRVAKPTPPSPARYQHAVIDPGIWLRNMERTGRDSPAHLDRMCGRERERPEQVSRPFLRGKYAHERHHRYGGEEHNRQRKEEHDSGERAGHAQHVKVMELQRCYEHFDGHAHHERRAERLHGRHTPPFQPVPIRGGWVPLMRQHQQHYKRGCKREL